MIGPIKVAIVGASGYSGEELTRLLLRHPLAELTAITSRQYAGQTLAQVFPKYGGLPRAAGLRFSEPKAELLARQAQVVFLALPHGAAAGFAVPLLDLGCQVIDLSADFRLKSAAVYKTFYGHDHPAPAVLEKSVYGLPEIHRAQIKGAALVAAPGCYPTSILLPLIPLLRAGLIHPESVIADSISGVSGAGRKVELDYLFGEIHESVRPYGIPRHRHLSEIEEQISTAAGRPLVMQFSPHLAPLNRGILTTIYAAPAPHFQGDDGAAAFGQKTAACYRAAYGAEPFVRLLEGDALPDTKNVVGTNIIEIAWRVDPRTGRLIVMSALDNIVKGASGQAVQCFNIVCGLPESAGLI